MNDKTTEQSIPDDFMEWIENESEGFVNKMKSWPAEQKVSYAGAMVKSAMMTYRHLHSLPPSPVETRVSVTAHWEEERQRLWYFWGKINHFVDQLWNDGIVNGRVDDQFVKRVCQVQEIGHKELSKYQNPYDHPTTESAPSPVGEAIATLTIADLTQEADDYKNMLLTIMSDVTEENWDYRIRRVLSKYDRLSPNPSRAGEPLGCHSEVGMTVGLIDSLMAIAHVLVQRDWDDANISEALKDVRADDDLKRIMDVGELSSAKEYIEEQRKSINTLSEALAFSNNLLKKQTERAVEVSPVLRWIEEEIQSMIILGEDRDRPIFVRENALIREQTLKEVKKRLTEIRLTPAEPVKDTPVEQKKAYAGLIDICSRSGMYTYVCPCEIHNNSGESPTEQPAQVPDPKGEIPEETEGIIEAIKDIQKRPFSATAKIMQAYADQKIATLTQQRDAALIAAQAHRQCLQVCAQGLREAGLPMAAEPIQAYLDKFPS